MTAAVEQSQLPDVMRRAADWLLEQQAASGGWAERHGSRVNALNTAESLIALLDSGQVQAGHAKVQAGADYLLNYKTGTRRVDDEPVATGPWLRAFEDEGGSATVPDLLRTSYALQALIRAGKRTDDVAIVSALAWLKEARNPDGGWAYGPGQESQVVPTCMGLLAFLVTGPVPDYRPIIESGIEHLISTHRNQDRSFGSRPNMAVVDTVFVALVLQNAQHRDVPVNGQVERDALDWLLGKREAPLRSVADRITPGPDDKGSYDYQFMTDTLVIRVLTGATDSAYHNRRLAREAMLSLAHRLDAGTYGFFGDRTFTWSTAHALDALSIARTRFEMFPEREPETVGVNASHLIFGFAITLALAVVVLTALDKFGLVPAAVLMFLMLASLLAYGRIGEQTFLEAIKSGFGVSGGSGTAGR